MLKLDVNPAGASALLKILEIREEDMFDLSLEEQDALCVMSSKLNDYLSDVVERFEYGDLIRKGA